MTPQEAYKIIKIWGKYVEYAHGKVFLIFGDNIPESLLPFPKKVIEEASSIMMKICHEQGKKEMEGFIGACSFALTSYIDDEKALLQASKDFQDQEWRRTSISTLKDFQKEWIKTQEA